MTTFGHKIAGASDDGIVDIYDSVTGVLRLSLSPADPIQAIKGSPDGSILFCAHKAPSITAWDIQTGGPIHTFVLERNPEDIAVSLKGRYLACRLSDGSAKIWEVADKMGGAAIWTTSPAASLCWLEPEERLAVSTGTSVCIWDIVAKRVIHNNIVWCPIKWMVYSQGTNRLATVASSAPGSAVTIFDVRTGAPAALHRTRQTISSFTSSHTTPGLVCGMEAHGLWLLDIRKGSLKHLEYPDAITSVSCLQNGTVVANFASSGIRLLNLDGGHTPSQKPTISPLTVHALDQDKILAIFPTSSDYIVLLESASMSQLLEIPIRNARPTPTDKFTILCASSQNRIAVRYFEEEERGFLQLWKFHHEAERWTVEVDGARNMSDLTNCCPAHHSRHCKWPRSYQRVERPKRATL